MSSLLHLPPSHPPYPTPPLDGRVGQSPCTRTCAMGAIIAANLGKYILCYCLLGKKAISEEAVEKWKESSPDDIV